MKKIEKLRDLGKYLDEHCLSFEAECDGLGEWRVRLRSVVEWEAGVTSVAALAHSLDEAVSCAVDLWKKKRSEEVK